MSNEMSRAEIVEAIRSAKDRGDKATLRELRAEMAERFPRSYELVCTVCSWNAPAYIEVPEHRRPNWVCHSCIRSSKQDRA